MLGAGVAMKPFGGYNGDFEWTPLPIAHDMRVDGARTRERTWTREEIDAQIEDMEPWLCSGCAYCDWDEAEDDQFRDSLLQARVDNRPLTFRLGCSFREKK
jgi:hypothetical protein